MCTLVQLISNKTVRIHDFPSLKFPHKYKDLVNELVRNLKTQNVKIRIIKEESQSFRQEIIKLDNSCPARN